MLLVSSFRFLYWFSWFTIAILDHRLLSYFVITIIITKFTKPIGLFIKYSQIPNRHSHLIINPGNISVPLKSQQECDEMFFLYIYLSTFASR